MMHQRMAHQTWHTKEQCTKLSAPKEEGWTKIYAKRENYIIGNYGVLIEQSQRDWAHRRIELKYFLGVRNLPIFVNFKNSFTTKKTLIRSTKIKFIDFQIRTLNLGSYAQQLEYITKVSTLISFSIYGIR